MTHTCNWCGKPAVAIDCAMCDNDPFTGEPAPTYCSRKHHDKMEVNSS